MVKTWTTRDKREIPIHEMEDSHLMNAIKMCRRNVPIYVERALASMWAYMEDAPEMAADAADQACYALQRSEEEWEKGINESSLGVHWLSVCTEHMPHLIVEANRRRLDLSFLGDDIYFKALEVIDDISE